MILTRFSSRFRSQRNKLIVGGMAAALVFGYAAGRRGSDISWVFRLLQGKSANGDADDCASEDSNTAQPSQSDSDESDGTTTTSRRWWHLW